MAGDEIVNSGMIRRLTPTADIRKLMISRTDELGDVILTLPLARAVKERRPDIELAFLVRPYISHLVDRIEEIDRTFTLPPNGNGRKIMKEYCPDAIIFAHPDVRLAIDAMLAKIDVRIGPGYRWFSGLFTRWVYDRRSRGGSHEAEFELDMLGPLFTGPFDLEMPKLPPMPAATEEAQAHLRKAGIERDYVIIHPIGRPELPGYPTGLWAEVARGLLDADEALSIVVTAGQGERDAALNLIELTDRPGRIVLIDTLSPNGVSELLRTARCFVSSASDGAHLAALVRTPVVALFPGAPPNWPQRRRPIGPYVTTLIPERSEGIPEGMRIYGENPENVIARIRPDRIIEAILRVRT